jgi:hypothetical protein
MPPRRPLRNFVLFQALVGANAGPPKFIHRIAQVRSRVDRQR